MTTLQEYLHNMRAALTTPGARAFYFPPNAQKRRTQNLRLAREIGPALAAFDTHDVERALGSLYGAMIVIHSLDTTGVQVDNKAFLAELRTSIEDWRGRVTSPPDPPLLAQM
jgi:hypothetical protein